MGSLMTELPLLFQRWADLPTGAERAVFTTPPSMATDIKSSGEPTGEVLVAIITIIFMWGCAMSTDGNTPPSRSFLVVPAEAVRVSLSLMKRAFLVSILAISTTAGCFSADIGLGGEPVPDSGLNTEATSVDGILVENYLDDDIYYYTIKPLKPLQVTVDGRKIEINEDIHIYSVGRDAEFREKLVENVGKNVRLTGVIRPKFDWNCMTRYVTAGAEFVPATSEGSEKR